MILFTRHPQVPPHWPGNRVPPPLTWDYAGPPESPFFDDDIAYCTCANSHTCRVVSKAHTISDDGALFPSYVCPVDGCGFHAHVKFFGWAVPICIDCGLHAADCMCEGG